MMKIKLVENVAGLPPQGVVKVGSNFYTYSGIEQRRNKLQQDGIVKVIINEFTYNMGLMMFGKKKMEKWYIKDEKVKRK